MSTPFTAADRDTFPRGPLYAIGAILALTVIAVSVVRVGDLGTSFVSTAAAQQERALRFEDRADGSIAVTDADSGDLVETVAPGTNGFLRGALRGLARERKRIGVGAEPPFMLTARADGRLTLDDPATKRQVDLKSFGQTNALVFEQLLLKRSAARTANNRVPSFVN
jgi:putative photosynthetic complex assembly protein